MCLAYSAATKGKVKSKPVEKNNILAYLTLDLRSYKLIVNISIIEIFIMIVVVLVMMMMTMTTTTTATIITIVVVVVAAAIVVVVVVVVAVVVEVVVVTTITISTTTIMMALTGAVWDFTPVVSQFRGLSAACSLTWTSDDTRVNYVQHVRAVSWCQGTAQLSVLTEWDQKGKRERGWQRP